MLQGAHRESQQAVVVDSGGSAQQIAIGILKRDIATVLLAGLTQTRVDDGGGECARLAVGGGSRGGHLNAEDLSVEIHLQGTDTASTLHE